MLLRSAASACTGPRGAVLLGYPAALQPRHRPKGGASLLFTGNVHDPEGQSTYCHVCNATLVGRDWYELLSINVRWSLLELWCRMRRHL
jgi:hypothetical protein